jgi:hypothetical protein
VSLIANGRTRQARFSTIFAGGGEAFIKKVKTDMGGRAPGRRTIEVYNSGFQLKEPIAEYLSEGVKQLGTKIHKIETLGEFFDMDIDDFFHAIRPDLASLVFWMKMEKMVEAAGVEPASENIPHGHLHAYPEV